MPFVPLHDLHPEVAKRETRSLTVLPGANISLPPGQYNFIEMFCNEPHCDCRRVFFTVFSLPAEKAEALIAWGWENAAFYQRWLGFDDPNAIEQMQGPALERSSPISRNAKVLLKFFAEVLLADPAYVERVKKHYAMFRATIDSDARPKKARRRPGDVAPTRQQPEFQLKVGRNDRCPCGSGKKFKSCCLKTRTRP